MQSSDRQIQRVIKKESEKKELTPEEREAAVKAAIEKRNKGPKTSKEDKSTIAEQIQQEKEKRGFKKPKVHGTEKKNKQ